jgi:hypothetical protein
MQGIEILGRSQYFTLSKGWHRKKKNIKSHYTIKFNYYYNGHRHQLGASDVDAIFGIAKPGKNIDSDDRWWGRPEFYYTNQDAARKIFMMLALHGY